MHETAAGFVRGKKVATIAEDAPLKDVAKHMRELGVGSLVVIDGGDRAIGIVTDRDLTVRAVAASVDVTSLALREVMTAPLISVSPAASLDTVVELMERHGVRRVPILDEARRVVGMIALDDLLQGTAREMNDLSKETQTMMRWAKRLGALERLQGELDEKLRDAHTRLRHANWYARESFLDQIDELRESIHKAFTGK